MPPIPFSPATNPLSPPNQAKPPARVPEKQPKGFFPMSIDKSMNVLIVDDYKTMLRIIRNLLKQIEFNNVEEASDGAEALSKLRTGNFGLVISDWNMAPMTGLQLLQEVRADSKLKS